jgi:hypothetical protein
MSMQSGQIGFGGAPWQAHWRAVPQNRSSDLNNDHAGAGRSALSCGYFPCDVEFLEPHFHMALNSRAYCAAASRVVYTAAGIP